jgi:hypothetical protein
LLRSNLELEFPRWLGTLQKKVQHAGMGFWKI